MVIQFSGRSSVPPRYRYVRNSGRKREGTLQYNREQTYEGEFLRDSLHGQGTYNWTNVGLYDGGFYSNCKEGYASISFPDSSYFEGLFVGNQPFGPGILTHPNGREDAGFWKGRKLVRLSRAVDFIIPRLAPTSAAKIKLLQFRRLIPVEEDNPSVTDILEKYGHSEDVSAPFSTLLYDKRSIFFDKRAFESAYFASPRRRIDFPSSPSLSRRLEEEEEEEEEEEGEEEDSLGEEFKENGIPSHCVCPTDVFVMEYEKEDSIDVCERESFRGENEMGILAYFNKYGIDGKPYDEVEDESDLDLNCLEDNLMEEEETKRDSSKGPKIVSWNRNELCTEMLKQIFRFRDFEGKLNFNLSKLMVGARTAFRKTGENEMQCLQFLKMCSLGPAHVIKGLLCAFQISEELMDARGNNSLMFAAATDKHDVIELLLNYGVDINSFNDEGLTPLNLCLLRKLAHEHNIYSWETAFLPKEIDETKYEVPLAQGYPSAESIPSLDRIFGDGMSLEDNRIHGLGSLRVSPPKSQSVMGVGSMERKLHIDKSEMSKSVLAVPSSKTQPSLSIVNWEWDFRPGKSVSVVALSNPTPLLNIKIVPKSFRRDEFQRSIHRTSKDKYLFEISFEEKPEPVENPEDPNNLVKKKQNKKQEKQEKQEKPEKKETIESEEETAESLTFDFDVQERITEIDKTIRLLLGKGADPNISEVPKPSIHLAIYMKELQTAHDLLSYGADPNSVLHANEGLLTPLHVIVLQKPSPEGVKLCELFLSFKADPDKETLPSFSLNEDEIEYLNFEQGRTPLHLLCMRPDLEYADPQGYLIRIALMLARAGQKKHSYNGHSYLTLTMLFGNMKLLKSLLIAEIFDPKEVLEKDRGTCLHVLVSGELQKRIPYETCIQMCDLLVGAGADPLKTFKNPRNLLGTCVDYGYRELGALREARYSEEFRGIKRSFSKARDVLKDHEKVLEYLAVIVGNTAKLKRKHFLEVGRFQRYKPSTDRYRHRRGRLRATSDGLESLSSSTIGDSETRVDKGSREHSLDEKASKLILPSVRAREMKKKSDAEDRKEVHVKEVKDQEVQEQEVQHKTEVEGKKGAKEESEKTVKKKKEKKEESDDKKAAETSKRVLSFDQDVELVEQKKEKMKKEDGKFSFGKSKKERKDSLALARLRASESHARKTERESKIALANAEDAIGSQSWTGTIKIKPGRRSTLKEDAVGIQLSRDKKVKGLTDDEKVRGETDGEKIGGATDGRKMKGATYGEKEPTMKERTEEWESKRGERYIPGKKGRLEGATAETDKREYSREAMERGAERTGRAPFKAHGRDSDAFRRDSDAYRRGPGEIRRGSDAFRRGPDAFGRGSDAFRRGPDGIRRGSDAFRRGSGTFGRGSDAFRRGPDGIRRGPDAFRRDSNAPGAEVASLRTVTDRRTSTTEVFPENLRKVLLRLYGNCANMDINEFLMPYVVLRDGQLYYKFKGKATKQKEQYSLI